MFWGSRMMNLGSEGVYLDEKCRTNPSRHLPGPKTPINMRDPRTRKGIHANCFGNTFWNTFFWQTYLANLSGKYVWQTFWATLFGTTSGQTFLANLLGNPVWQTLWRTDWANLRCKLFWQTPLANLLGKSLQAHFFGLTSLASPSGATSLG